MIERILTFGRHGDQVGILTLPDVVPDNDRPAVVIWNTGVNHRVGPFRFAVDLARAAASLGFVALRFDASGMGDSEIRRDGIDENEREDRDVLDAFDAVTRRAGSRRFVVLGYCSSVDAAHRVAVKDPRVVGAVQIEGYSFRTPGYRRRAPLRALSAERWRRLLLRNRDRLVQRLSGNAPAPRSESVFKRDYPTWAQYRRDLVTLTQRGASLLQAYVGTDSDFNHVEQFWEMFATPQLDRTRIEIAYYPKADHTFFDVHQRALLVERICAWLRIHHVATTPSR